MQEFPEVKIVDGDCTLVMRFVPTEGPYNRYEVSFHKTGCTKITPPATEDIKMLCKGFSTTTAKVMRNTNSHITLEFILKKDLTLVDKVTLLAQLKLKTEFTYTPHSGGIIETI